MVLSKWRAELAGPCDRLVPVEGKQQIEFLGEELVVIVQRVAEEWKRLGERAAAGHQLRPAAREKIQCDEVLIHTHGVGRAQTVTALLSLICSVMPAIVASTISGADAAMSGR